MPPGIQAPLVVQFNASSVPVVHISLSSDTLNEQQLYDYGIYRIRQQLAPIPGITLPTPAGEKRSWLQGLGIVLGDNIKGDYSTLALVCDPDGNLLTLATPPSRPYPPA